MVISIYSCIYWHKYFVTEKIKQNINDRNSAKKQSVFNDYVMRRRKWNEKTYYQKAFKRSRSMKLLLIHDTNSFCNFYAMVFQKITSKENENSI